MDVEDVRQVSRDRQAPLPRPRSLLQGDGVGPSARDPASLARLLCPLVHRALHEARAGVTVGVAHVRVELISHAREGGEQAVVRVSGGPAVCPPRLL